MKLLEKIILLCEKLDIEKIKKLETEDKNTAVATFYQLQNKIDAIIKKLSRLRIEIVEKRVELEIED